MRPSGREAIKFIPEFVKEEYNKRMKKIKNGNVYFDTEDSIKDLKDLKDKPEKPLIPPNILISPRESKRSSKILEKEKNDIQNEPNIVNNFLKNNKVTNINTILNKEKNKSMLNNINNNISSQVLLDNIHKNIVSNAQSNIVSSNPNTNRVISANPFSKQSNNLINLVNNDIKPIQIDSNIKNIQQFSNVPLVINSDKVIISEPKETRDSYPFNNIQNIEEDFFETDENAKVFELNDRRILDNKFPLSANDRLYGNRNSKSNIRQSNDENQLKQRLLSSRQYKSPLRNRPNTASMNKILINNIASSYSNLNFNKNDKSKGRPLTAIHNLKNDNNNNIINININVYNIDLNTRYLNPAPEKNLIYLNDNLFNKNRKEIQNEMIIPVISNRPHTGKIEHANIKKFSTMSPKIISMIESKNKNPNSSGFIFQEILKNIDSSRSKKEKLTIRDLKNVV